MENATEPVVGAPALLPRLRAKSADRSRSFAFGEASVRPTLVEDVTDTMRVIEAAHRSSERGGVSLSELTGSRRALLEEGI